MTLQRTSSTLLESLACHLKSLVDAGKVSQRDVYKVKTRGARIGSRIRWAEEGEASTRFFLGLEKQRGARNWIAAMHRARWHPSYRYCFHLLVLAGILF